MHLIRPEKWTPQLFPFLEGMCSSSFLNINCDICVIPYGLVTLSVCKCFWGCLADVAPTAATHQLMVPTMILWWAQTLNLRVTMVIHIGKREDWRLDAAVVRFCVWGI